MFICVLIKSGMVIIKSSGVFIKSGVPVSMRVN